MFNSLVVCWSLIRAMSWTVSEGWYWIAGESTNAYCVYFHVVAYVLWYRKVNVMHA